MKYLRLLIPALFAVSLLIPAFGCEQEGPAEKAGKKIDEAVEKTKEKTKEIWEDAKDKAKDLSE